MKSRFAPARKALIFWTLFIGLGAVGGAACMLADPSGRSVGMSGMLPYFQVLPFADVLFQDLFFSGIALLLVNGITNLTAAALLFRKKPAGAMLGGVFGITLMLWILIQFYMFPLNFMSTLYFIFGFCQAATGYAAWVFQRQEAFQARPLPPLPLVEHPRRLVVYFSRMGYVKKLAYEIAEKTGAAVYEIRSTERTEGTLGFWWCGRFGMHRWDMPIRPIDVDLSAFEHVTLCAPIWVFALAAPVRAFCRQAAGQIREADYLLVHHTSGRYESAAREMDRLLGLKHTALRSVQCKVGAFREIQG
ncbi:MAG: hypothetical protein SOW23_08235 [Eubacteriales bacterium]|nr:hypothetical protein [Clostridiales bacterium]MDY2601767.1 hypothetical protein [Eubacteriales bacterium]